MPILMPVTPGNSAAHSSKTPSGLVPLVVASTGHRDFPAQDRQHLEMSVNDVLDQLNNQSPHSPKWLINGLAEGADRLVARCALALGWELHAIIPVSFEAFENTMSSESAREEFRDLLSKCSSVTVIELSSNEPDQMFVDVANTLCTQGQWLIALWDGKDALGPGGTGAVVKKFREGLEEGFSDIGPVFHLYTRRSEADNSSAAVGAQNLLHPRHFSTKPESGQPSNGAQWNSILSRISDYNRLAQACLQNNRIRESIEEERQELGDLPDADESEIRNLDRLGWLYAVADHLSKKYQNLRKWVFYWMVFWSMIAIFTEQLYSGPYQDNKWLLIACLIGAVLAISPLALRNNRDIGISWMESMYLDCRALSEACRVQYYWRLTGLHDSAADFYLEEQRDELEWIRQAIRSTDIGVMQIKPRLPEVLDIALEKWIVGQRTFFIGAPTKRNRAKDNQDTADRHDIAFKTALILVILFLGSALVLELAFATFKGKCLPWLQMFWGFFLAMSAAIKLHQRTFAYSENARRYTSMGLQVKNVEERLLIEQKNNFEDIDKCRQLLLSYGKAALEESGYWMILLRDRQVRPPIGS